MNLFIFGWNMPKQAHAPALGELRQMVNIYPQLDCDTIWYYSNETVFAGSMHTNREAVMNRRYVYQDNDQIVFYDGCLIDCTDKFNGMDAADLSLYWNQLHEALEGQFAVVRITKNKPRIELLNDFLGMGQLYYFKKDKTWLVSNSVHLLVQISKATSLDPLGISLFLSMGWVGSNRTLRHSIRLVPGGVYWKWQKTNDSPVQEHYHSPRDLSVLPRRRKFTRSDSLSLSDKLTKMCARLAKSCGKLDCPITGGRDSRVLVGLLMRGGIRAQYYTDGSPYSIETKIGKQIAKTFNLPYNVNKKTVEDVSSEWEDAAWRLIKQNDGMVSLWQIADVLRQPSHVDSLGIRLWGIGGEIARGFYTNPLLFLGRKNAESAKRYLRALLLSDHGGIITKEAMRLCEEYLYRWVEHAIEDGFSPIDIPDAFYTYERIGRWASSNARKVHPIVDLFSPFCTRPFVEAAFAMPPLYRYSEPIHYQLVLLLPKLHKIPFEKEPWRSQLPGINMTKSLLIKTVRKLRPLHMAQISAFDQYTVLEEKCSQLRTFCLDQSDSMLWSFVNRSVFENITSPKSNPNNRRKYVPALYQIITLFYYSVT